MSYWLGDNPTAIVFELPEHLEPDAIVDADVTLNGDTVLTSYGEVEGLIIVDAGTLETVGVSRALARLTLADEGGIITVELEPLVVEDQATQWATIAETRTYLAGADISDALLYTVLEIARDEVLAFAPRLPDDAPVPLHYRQGQIMQARNKYNAARVNPSGDVGDGSWALSRYPLDWQIRQTLRPLQGLPRVR